MTPKRWDQVKEIFHLASGLERDKRAAFLAGTCGSDDALRREVESLLAAHDKDV